MKIKFVFLQTLLILGIATLLAYAGKVATVPAADGSQNVNELNGVGITVKTTGGDGTATLSTTVQGDSTTYTSNPQAIPSADFPLDTTTNVVATVTHIPCTPNKPVTFHVKSQTPTAPLVYGSCSAVSGGYAYPFTVNDQNTIPIKNASSLCLNESFSGTVTLTNDSGTGIGSPSPISGSGVATSAGTNSGGVITDTPVGGTFSSLEGVAVFYAEDVNYLLSESKTYPSVSLSTRSWTMNFTQTQTVKEKAVYSSITNTATASDVSGAP